MVGKRLIRMVLWLCVVRAAMVIRGSQWWWRSDRWVRSRASMMGPLALATSMMGGLAIPTSWVPSTSPHLSAIDGLSETWQYEVYACAFFLRSQSLLRDHYLDVLSIGNSNSRVPLKVLKAQVLR